MTRTDDKRTRHPKREKRAPKVLMTGYGCVCGQTGLKPDEFMRDGRCIDCSTWTPDAAAAYEKEL